jgi:hypothetical protein
VVPFVSRYHQVNKLNLVHDVQELFTMPESMQVLSYSFKIKTYCMIVLVALTKGVAVQDTKQNSSYFHITRPTSILRHQHIFVNLIVFTLVNTNLLFKPTRVLKAYSLDVGVIKA